MNKINKTSIVGVIIIVLGFLILSPLLKNKQIEQLPLPDNHYSTVNGTIVNIDTSDEPYILFFWATWCEICKIQLPEMKDLAEQYKVLYVSADSGTNMQVMQVINSLELGLAETSTINDESGEIIKSFRIFAYPSTLIIQNDKISFYKTGYVSQSVLKSKLN